METAVLGQHIVGPNGIRVVVGHPLGAVLASRLFVGHTEEDQVALWPEVGVGQVAKHHSHCRGQAEHVDCATAPDFAVDQFATEWITIPAVAVDGHNIGVPVQAQTRRIRIAALDPGNDRRAARRSVVSLDIETSTCDVGLEQVSITDLLARLLGAFVHTLVANHVLQQVDGLVCQLGCRRHARCSFWWLA